MNKNRMLAAATLTALMSLASPAHALVGTSAGAGAGGGVDAGVELDAVTSQECLASEGSVTTNESGQMTCVGGERDGDVVAPE
jgi:hypothetical protein